MREKHKSETNKRILKTKAVLKLLLKGELFQLFKGLRQMTGKKLGF